MSLPFSAMTHVELPKEEPQSANVSSVKQLLRQAPPAAAKVLRALDQAQARHTIFLPNQPIVIAVSGGADSLCLLHALHQLAPIWRLSLHVAHVDHALRPTSAADAAFVAALAQKFALPYYTIRLTPGIVDDDPAGQEGAARSARYAFLRQVANHIGEQIGEQMDTPVTVATAHHQDDQAETLLLHLVQGSGLPGLAGMTWVGELPDAFQPPIRLVRPFLAIDRAAIQNYLRSYGQEWREDESNHDPSHLRNKLRHQVLPLLATINPNIQATLARTANLLAVEADHAASRDRAALTDVMVNHTPSTRLVLDLFRLAQVDQATQRGVLRQALLTLGVDLRAVGLQGIDTLLNLAQNATASGPHPLIAGWAWTLLRSGLSRHLSIHRADTLPIPVEHPHVGKPFTMPLPLPREGIITHNGWQLQSSILTPSELPADWRSRNHPWRFFCDAERCSELMLTTFAAEMRIAPLGMGGKHRAVGDIFTDGKISTFLRPGWPVVIKKDGTVVWLCGLITDESVRVQSATRQVRQLHWQRESQVEP